jgi:hypothetical protein
MADKTKPESVDANERLEAAPNDHVRTMKGLGD